MKKKMKRTRFISLILSLLMLFPILIVPIQAANLPNLSSAKYISGYTLNSSGKIYMYTDATLSKKTGGWIDCSTDECRIIGVDGDALLISYPTPSGRRTAWCHADAFTKVNLDGNLQCVTATGKMSAFKRAVGSSTYGSVYKNDLIYILGWESGRLQIIYPAGNRWKLAFVSESDASKYLGVTRSGTNATTNTNTSYCVINGTFTFSSALNRNLGLDVENNSFADCANLQLYTLSAGNMAQIFRVQHMFDGWHKIIHVASGNAVDVAGGVAAAMVNVWLYDSSDPNNAAQLWRFYKNADGSYVIQNKLGYVLNVQNGSARNNSNIWTYINDLTKSCFFFLNTVNVTTTPSVSNNVSSDTWQYPMNNAYVCGNDWSQYYRARPARPDHVGIDIASHNGDNRILAAADGTIVKTGYNSSNGYYVIIKHTLSGKTVYSFYAHLSSITRTSGFVSKGQQVGVMGNTGSASAGAHLHFAVVDKLWNGSYYGYVPSFNGDKTRYSNVTYYNPHYIVKNDKLPA